VLQRPAQAVGGPDGQHVELAAHGCLQDGVEGRSLVTPLGAADAGVFVHLYEVVPGMLRPRLELFELVGGGLLAGADTDVDGDAFGLANRFLRLISRVLDIL
jgi:hypothetical protein